MKLATVTKVVRGFGGDSVFLSLPTGSVMHVSLGWGLLTPREVGVKIDNREAIRCYSNSHTVTTLLGELGYDLFDPYEMIPGALK